MKEAPAEIAAQRGQITKGTTIMNTTQVTVEDRPAWATNTWRDDRMTIHRAYPDLGKFSVEVANVLWEDENRVDVTVHWDSFEGDARETQEFCVQRADIPGLIMALRKALVLVEGAALPPDMDTDQIVVYADAQGISVVEAFYRWAAVNRPDLLEPAGAER